MYVRYEKPVKKDGSLVVASKKGKGMLVARGAIGPTNPALPNVEMTSFGVWQDGDGKIYVTPPEGQNGFPHLSGRLVKTTTEQEGEDGKPVKVIDAKPALGGKQEIEKLCAAMGATFKANQAQAFAIGSKFELPTPFGSGENKVIPIPTLSKSA